MNLKLKTKKGHATFLSMQSVNVSFTATRNRFPFSEALVKACKSPIELNNGVARALIKLRTLKGDYWIKQCFSSVASLFQSGNFS